MDIYQEQPDGSFTLGGKRIPNDPRNKDRRALLDAVAGGTAEVQAAPVMSSADIEAARAKDQALRYLAATDWYTLREADGGTAAPQAIKDARAQARLDASL